MYKENKYNIEIYNNFIYIYLFLIIVLLNKVTKVDYMYIVDI